MTERIRGSRGDRDGGLLSGIGGIAVAAIFFDELVVLAVDVPGCWGLATGARGIDGAYAVYTGIGTAPEGNDVWNVGIQFDAEPALRVVGSAENCPGRKPGEGVLAAVGREAPRGAVRIVSSHTPVSPCIRVRRPVWFLRRTLFEGPFPPLLTRGLLYCQLVFRPALLTRMPARFLLRLATV